MMICTLACLEVTMRTLSADKSKYKNSIKQTELADKLFQYLLTSNDFYA